MKNLYNIFSFGIILQTVVSIKISIYYESLCYDSTRFIAFQLQPNYQKLKNYIQLEFVPFGKATHNFQNNKWTFDCQHGPNECTGNKYQSCALAQNSTQDEKMAFVHCIMRERNPADVKKIEYCARRYHFNWENLSKCAKGGEGDELLAKNGDKTNNLEPNLSFVPTIIYNDRFDNFLQEKSLTDFAAIVCSKIEGQKPEVCQGRILPRKQAFADYFYY